MTPYTNAVLFYNVKSGQSKDKQYQKTFIEHFSKHLIDLKIVEIPKSVDEKEEIVTQAISEGANLFIAAGGDGTVSLLSNLLIGTELPLGIIPLGTGNLLAKELGIPQKLEDALDLITAKEQKTINIDTMKLNNKYYNLNVSVGLSPKIMEGTESEDKQRLGIIAYLMTFFQQILGLKLYRFIIEFDHHKETHLASEILITNGQSTGIEALKWSDDIRVNDGVMEIFIIRAANIYDVLGVLYSVFSKNKKTNPAISTLKFQKHCRIETQNSLSVQADGDSVGKTPIDIQLVPKSLTVIVSKDFDGE